MPPRGTGDLFSWRLDDRSNPSDIGSFAAWHVSRPDLIARGAPGARFDEEHAKTTNMRGLQGTD